MPKDRLNLTVDPSAINRARRYSERHGVSVSRLVNDFLSSLPIGTNRGGDELTPLVRRLAGAASGDADRDAYRRHVLRKYGGRFS